LLRRHRPPLLIRLREERARFLDLRAGLLTLPVLGDQRLQVRVLLRHALQAREVVDHFRIAEIAGEALVALFDFAEIFPHEAIIPAGRPPRAPARAPAPRGAARCEGRRPPPPPSRA